MKEFLEKTLRQNVIMTENKGKRQIKQCIEK